MVSDWSRSSSSFSVQTVHRHTLRAVSPNNLTLARERTHTRIHGGFWYPHTTDDQLGGPTVGTFLPPSRSVLDTQHNNNTQSETIAPPVPVCMSCVTLFRSGLWKEGNWPDPFPYCNNMSTNTHTRSLSVVVLLASDPTTIASHNTPAHNRTHKRASQTHTHAHSCVLRDD